MGCCVKDLCLKESLDFECVKDMCLKGSFGFVHCNNNNNNSNNK